MAKSLDMFNTDHPRRETPHTMGRKRGRNDDPAPSSTAPPVALAAGRGAPVEAPDVVLPEVWCYGVDALSSGCCGRLAACSKGHLVALLT